MNPDTNIGHYYRIIARRDAVIVRNPHLRAKILGLPPAYTMPTETKITVDCRTGERTVKRLTQFALVVEEPKPAVMRGPSLPTIISKAATPPRRPSDPKRPARVSAYNARTAIGGIVLVCAKHWDTTAQAIMASGHARIHARPRFACMKLMRDLLGLSMPAIGWALGGRDHTTVMNAYERAQDLLEADADWRARYEAALAELIGGPA